MPPARFSCLAGAPWSFSPTALQIQPVAECVVPCAEKPYRCRRRSARDWRRTNARRFLMKALMLCPAPPLMHAFRQNPLGLSGYTAFFVSSAKPGLGHLSVIRAAYIGLMDLLAKARSYFSNLLLRSDPSSPQSALHRSRYFTH